MNVESFIHEVAPLWTRAQLSVMRRFGRAVSGGRCYCVYCEKNSPFFLPYWDGVRSVPQVLAKLDMVGSDIVRFFCPKCESNDRERHLKLYCEKLEINRLIAGARILHFAPERHFGDYVAAATPLEHVKADLFPSSPAIQRVDMLAMDFPTESFDMVIANHVLEHVADDSRALSEIRRVLRPGGLAILQTPYSAMLHTSFEDSGIVTKSAREHVYGQDDHVRLYGQDIFLRFTAAGFISRVAQHEAVLFDIDPEKYGINPREPFFLFEKTC
jgi:SAM-dependent methyltransferase